MGIGRDPIAILASHYVEGATLRPADDGIPVQASEPKPVRPGVSEKTYYLWAKREAGALRVLAIRQRLRAGAGRGGPCGDPSPSSEFTVSGGGRVARD